MAVFKIFYDKPNQIYMAGDNLTGHVEIGLNTKLSVQCIYILIQGIAETQWTERNNNENVTFSGREQYLYSRTNVFGHENGPILNLLAGLHTHSFACALPQQLPASLEGKYGGVRYMVQVTMVIPMGIDKNFISPFSIYKPLDLNDYALLRAPLEMENIKRFCLLTCSLKPLIVTVRIPQSGYAPGEFITIVANVINQCSIKIHGVEFEINKRIQFQAKEPLSRMREDDCTIANFFASAENMDTSKFSAEGKLLVPTTAISERESEIIRVNYFVKVIVRVSTCARNSIVTLPITIGTHPIQTQSNVLSQASNTMARASMVTNKSYPPSYAATMENENYDPLAPMI